MFWGYIGSQLKRILLFSLALNREKRSKVNDLCDVLVIKESVVESA